MRVATKTLYDMVKFNLSHISAEMKKANNVVSSGKRITTLSDDPSGLTESLRIRSTLSNITQLGRNISLGKSWLTAAESALSHTQDMLSDAKALCVQMASSTTTSDKRISASGAVQNVLDEMISLSNTQVSGRYIFAGSKTDAVAFASDGTYSGDNNPFTVKIGQNATIQVGNDGDALFSDIFTTMSNLKDDLQSNNPNGIQAAIDYLDRHLDDISNKISDIGSKTVRMEINEKIFQDLSFTNTERLSKIEDADIAEAIIELSEIELVYQAALASSSRVLETSLVDYLK